MGIKNKNLFITWNLLKKVINYTFDNNFYKILLYKNNKKPSIF